MDNFYYMARPKKYHSEQQRKAAKKQSQKRLKRISGRYFRLVIPFLKEYGTDWKYSDQNIRDLRAKVVDLLHSKQKSRGLDKYSVAVQRHPGNGLVHLDILLVYNKVVKNTYTRYDYVIKHGNITKYRTLNKAILDYNQKEDPNPIKNFNIESIIIQSRIKTDLYSMMEQAMLENPFNFNPIEWLSNNKLTTFAMKTNIFKIIRMIKQNQNLECNRILRNKPGIRLITRELIESTFTPQQLAEYDSWTGYQIIIDHINQIPLHGYKRPHKTKNLLIVGRPNTGKTTLALQIEKYVSVYYKDVSNWFPKYENNVYKMILWNEFSLKGLKYPKLLNLLEGTKMDLEFKGGSVLKTDRQLIYMTSNIELQRHIDNKFKLNSDRVLARANLGARITEVIIPDTRKLFLLLRLIQKGE